MGQARTCRTRRGEGAGGQIKRIRLAGDVFPLWLVTRPKGRPAGHKEHENK